MEHKGDTIVRLQWPDTGVDYVPRDVHIEHLKPIVGRPLREVMEKPSEIERPVDALDVEAIDVEMATEEETEDVTEDVVQRAEENVPAGDQAEENVPAGEQAPEVLRRTKRRRKAPDYFGVEVNPQETDDESDTQDEEDTQEYRVKRILAKRRGPQNRWEYKVQFSGYSPREAIWLSGSCLNKKALKAADLAPEVDKRVQ